MRLHELFNSATPVKDRLRQMAVDFLTPLIAHKVPFVTVQQVIDELRQGRTGILVDRALVMSLLDPASLKAVNSIEGDRINLQQPSEIDRKEDDDGAEKAVDKIKDMAKRKAKQDIEKE